MKFKVLIVFILFAFTNSFGAEIERRAVFFFDSDKIELCVADVDLKENKVVQKVFCETENIPFSHDLVGGSRKSPFSKKTENAALNSVKKLMKKVETFNPQTKKGFAGESFRKAENAQDLIKKIHDETSLHVLILSEEQEGVVEFIATVNSMQIDPAKVVTWNIGWNFMRLTAQCGENYSVYLKDVERDVSIHVLNTLNREGKERKRLETFHIVPLSEEESKKEIAFVKNSIQDIPTCIREKVANPKTVVLKMGKRYSMLKPHSGEYTLEKIREALRIRIGKWQEIAYKQDRQIYPNASFNHLYTSAVANLILTYGVMDALGIQHLKIVDEPDTILGLLLYKPTE
jgi:hypothetical protein